MRSEVLQMACRHIDAVHVGISVAGISAVGINCLSISAPDRSEPFAVFRLFVGEFGDSARLPIEQSDVGVRGLLRPVSNRQRRAIRGPMRSALGDLGSI